MPGRLLRIPHALLSAALLGALCACPPAVQPSQPCNASRDCPDGQLCRDGLCRSASPSPDAAALDASGLVDAARDAAAAPDHTRDGPGEDAAATDGASRDQAASDLGAMDQGPQDATLGDAGACARAGCPWFTNCVEQADGGASCLCNWETCDDGEVCLLPEGDLGGGPRCCGAGQRNCDGLCVDVATTPQYCGACDRACAWGETCEGGACRCGATSCDPSGQDCCGGICRDVLSDALHCGPLGTGLGCGALCAGGSLCEDGRCACTGAGQCGDTGTCCDDSYCANLAVDPRNCGQCHLACAGGERCEGSTCVCGPGCDDGLVCTEDRCVDTRCAHSTLDGDNDGYCHASCPDALSGDSTGECVDGDCDDSRGGVHPGADEICDGLDNDCSASTRDGTADCAGRCCGSPPACRVCCAAADCGAGAWQCTDQYLCLCEAPLVICAGECRGPNACGGCGALTGVPDQPCGQYMCGVWTCDVGGEGVSCVGDHPRVTYLRDRDLDSFGVDADSLQMCAPGGEYTATRGGDCADDDPQRNPGKPELCNGVDDNCAQDLADDGAAVCSGRCCGTPAACHECCEADDCGTGGWSCTPGFTCACSPPRIDCDGDCRAPNACGGCALLAGAPGQPCGVDSCGTWQCTASQEAVTCAGDHPAQTYFLDDDDDGYGVTADSLRLCQPVSPFSAVVAGDCDDSCPTCYPGARELCDQLLNDCSLAVVDGPTCWWDAAWQQRALLRFDRTSRTTILDDYPLLVVLDPTRIVYSAVQAGQTDLRFVDADTREVLAYEVEQWSSSGVSLVWVKIRSVDASPSDHVWLYWRNPLATPPTRLPSEVWSNGFRGVYHLASNAVDSTNRAPVGQLHGTNEVAGQIGTGLRFSGSSWIDLGRDLDALQEAPAATISLWMRADTLPGPGATLAGWTVDLPYPTQITRAALEIDLNDLRVLGRTVDATTPYYDVVSNAPSLTPGRWYLLTGVLDFAGGRILGYIDNEQRASATRAFDPSTPPSPSTCGAIGAEEDGSTDYFQGTLDEVRVSNKVRSLSWVRADYDAQRDQFITYNPPESF